jgi:hypothetical protein
VTSNPHLRTGTPPADILRADSGRPGFGAPWQIFWVGFALRVACILIGHTYRFKPFMDHFGFGWEMGRIARSVATGQGYGNPFNGYSGPTAWLPPLYPLLMAAAFKLFGVYTNAAALFLLVMNSVFSAAAAPAVYEIGARCFDAKGIARRASLRAMPVALWAGWLWAVYPAVLQYPIHWIWEMSLSTFLFAWLIVLALRLRGVGDERGYGATKRRLGLWAGFGGLWGLMVLSNASLLLCFPAMVVWIAWPALRAWRMDALKRAVLGAVLMAGVFVLVMTPWVVRNERVLHAFVPTRSNLGIELYNSTLDANDGMPWGAALPLWSGDPGFQMYARMGEVKFAAMRQAQAMARIRARPLLFARRAVDRVFFFWDGTPHAPDRHPAQEYLRELSYSFISVCGLLGLALMLRRRVEGAGLFALIFGLAPLPYYLVTVQARFRHPIEPLIAVLAVYLFRSAGSREQGVRSRGDVAEA